MLSSLQTIAEQFSGTQAINSIKPLGQGLINDTYLVNTTQSAFVLQRINQQVFPQPAQIMANLQHLHQHLLQWPSESVKLRIPAIIQTNQQQIFLLDQNQQFWRALELIQPAESREQLRNQAEAAQVGFALGHFHRLCSNLATTKLYDTLPGFHITPNYFRQYLALPLQNSVIADPLAIEYCSTFIGSFGEKIYSLEAAKKQGQLKERVIHGDPKLNNFLFKPNSNEIISLIDLDTVKPGLIHYDIGDCLRSCCQSSDNRFDLDCAEIILTHYLQETKQFFTPADYAYLYSAILLIPFELGLRFFSDFLAGNHYFKVTDPEHNLRRAMSLFKFCADIEQRQQKIEKMVARIKIKNKV